MQFLHLEPLRLAKIIPWQPKAGKWIFEAAATHTENPLLCVAQTQIVLLNKLQKRLLKLFTLPIATALVGLCQQT
jgi:hypothetical protein